MILDKILGICILSLPLWAFSSSCKLPDNLVHLEEKIETKPLLNHSDIKRNVAKMENLCRYLLSFREGKYSWKMVLVYNPQRSSGPFWFLPHDDERDAFDSAIYSTRKYGGGFLAVLAHDNRYFNGQDPNRNFGESKQSAKTCRQQKSPAPIYSKNVFKVIDTFRSSGLPYLALHNNRDGWHGNGGSGGVSILNSSRVVKSYPSGSILLGKCKGVKDEDSLVYIAGTSSNPPQSKLNDLINAGIHVKYEVVSQKHNDCSMSNYIILNKGSDYYNIETELGDGAAQRKMIDVLMSIIRVTPLKP
ncbi:MAG: hypothetical protein U9R27_05605 [Campylobacterota bacterium]|nr:hypothetical protein [Campylobacterota bacterium]